MKLRLKLLPWLALGAGIVGAGLRLAFSHLGADDRGLLPAAHPTLILLYILMVLVPTLLFLALRNVNNNRPYEKLFPAGIAPLVGCVLGFLGISYNFICNMRNATDLLSVLTLIAAVPAALCLLLIGYCRWKALKVHYAFHSIITLYLTLQLVSFYRTWNTLPQLQGYLPQLLALVFLMLSGYQHSALNAGIGKCRAFSFYNLGSVFFCLSAAVDSRWPFYLGMAAWCLTSQCTLEEKPRTAPMVLPQDVLSCISTLEAAGYKAYAVGGCVRDHLLGRKPADYDLCTDATPEQMCQLFSQHELVRNGEKHGTIGVVLSKKLYEITTFRTEGGYSDTRHPDWVEFVTDLKQDLARRDFTVNAIAYSPAEGFVDPFGGQQDLKNKVLRAVGEPEVRFREDALRILRGVRFAVRFDLTPEENTLSAMERCAPLMENLARERVCSELCKLLPLISETQMGQYRTVITQVIPALGSAPLYDAAARVVGLTPPELPVRLAALLYLLGEEMAENILRQLRVSNVLRERTLGLIRLLVTPLSGDKKQLRHLAGQLGNEALGQAIALQKAVAQAQGQDTTDLEMADLLLHTIQRDGSCLSVKDLTITGSDLLSLGAQPGPHIGKCMQSLLSLVQEDVLANTKEELLEAAKAFLEL